MKVRSPNGPLRVLVIDDSRDMCDSTALLMHLWGHEACVATDGPAGLTAITAFKPDVVLLDISMPGMDGYEVARHIRKLGALGRPLVVSLSGFGGGDYCRRALEAGCDLYWIKPVEPEKMEQLLESCAKQRADRAFAAS